MYIHESSFDLYVWILGLSYGTDDHTLKDAFSGFGDVVEGEFLCSLFVLSKYYPASKSYIAIVRVCVVVDSFSVFLTCSAEIKVMFVYHIMLILFKLTF